MHRQLVFVKNIEKTSDTGLFETDGFTANHQ